MKTVIILGADRVGKTTVIDKSIELITSCNLYKYVALHYSEIKPQFHSPIEQFLTPLKSFNPYDTGLLICDRFSPDTLFYESYRHQTGQYPKEYSHIVESSYLGISEELNVILICPPWTDEIEGRHRKELTSQNPGCSEWWLSRMLGIRKKEHWDYYEFMQDYLQEESLFKDSQLHYHSKIDNIFDVLPHYSQGDV
jgi:hypothetical protein